MLTRTPRIRLGEFSDRIGIRRNAGLNGREQAAARLGDLGDRAVEGLLVDPRGLVEAADLAYELERGPVEFVGCGGESRPAENFNASAHIYFYFLHGFGVEE